MTGSHTHPLTVDPDAVVDPVLELVGSAVERSLLPETLGCRVHGHLETFAEHMREGLLAASTAIGLEVMDELMQAEVTALVGEPGRHNADRCCYRHGSEPCKVTLGGRRVPVRRPRVRTTGDGADGGEEREVALETYATFADTDLLAGHMVAAMLAGVSTRRYPAALEPVGERVSEQASSTSKSAVSRRFVAATAQRLAELCARPLGEDRWLIVYIDGFTFADHQLVGALGVTADGAKVPLGVVEGSTENKTLCTRLLADLAARGLDASKGILFVVDGSKALDGAITAVFGGLALTQRCRRHKERNVTDHLPESEHAWVRRKLREAWAKDSAEAATEALESLAATLARKRPGAAASLREGLHETVTVNRLGITGALLRTVDSTNPVESMIEIVRWHARRVKRWRDGDMALRWAAAGMLAAQRQFRRVKGYRGLPALAAALERAVAGQPGASEGADAASARASAGAA